MRRKWLIAGTALGTLMLGGLLGLWALLPHETADQIMGSSYIIMQFTFVLGFPGTLLSEAIFGVFDRWNSTTPPGAEHLTVLANWILIGFIMDMWTGWRTRLRRWDSESGPGRSARER